MVNELATTIARELTGFDGRADLQFVADRFSDTAGQPPLEDRGDLCLGLLGCSVEDGLFQCFKRQGADEVCGQLWIPLFTHGVVPESGDVQGCRA